MIRESGIIRKSCKAEERLYAHAIYPLSGDPYRIDTYKHGLTLAGFDINVRWADPNRKTGSDKKHCQPLIDLGTLQLYLEREQRAAGQ